MASSSPVSSSTASSAASSSGTNASPPATVDYSSFLQLLVAELKNQDPTSPTDPTQYMSQLASFSSVEQQVQTNSKLDSLLTASSLGQAETVIGKTITSADGSISGKVQSVTVSSGTATATLDNGGQVKLADGISIGS
ncbi:flagellar hook assembly protein FlgD [Beijerinckia indica]|uniref:flagellar hook assembly protein FlgD n=1 Tax=Beijerinckia indica TaxID=533 RepID=UPI00186B9B87|nr:flagellar hook assembly protein FlgD [Beijerinckia indica]